MIDKFMDDLETFLNKWNITTIDREGWYLKADNDTLIFKATLEMKLLKNKKG